MLVVTDDAGDVAAELVEKLNIKIIPINVMFGTEEFLSGVDMDRQSFYRKVASVGDHNFPKTSQPTPYQYEEFFRELMKSGETEFYVTTISEKLSGTYASAVAAKQALEGEATIHLFDSKAGSAAQGFMTVEAARMAQSGASGDEITAKLSKMRDEMVVCFMIDSLEFAVKGGRVKPLRGTIASMLNIKPIMRLDDGLIVEEGRVRTLKKAHRYIVDYVKQRVGDKPIKFAAIHAGAPLAGQAILDLASSQLNVAENMLVDMTIPVAINLGPGALGLVAIPE